MARRETRLRTRVRRTQARKMSSTISEDDYQLGKLSVWWDIENWEDAADKRMMIDMIFWAYDNPAPATYLLMSGDSDFMYVLKRLYKEKYEVMAACRENRRLYNPPIISTTWDLNSLLRGELPIGREFYF